MQIILSLDCTGSMGELACPTCATTRMQEQKRAVLQFLDAVENTEGHEKVKLGISVFSMKADWLYTTYAADGTPTGTAVRPDNNLSLDQMRLAVQDGFGISGENESAACKKLNTYTSLGTGLAFMHDYLRTQEVEGVKQVEVMITDGEPNQRTPYAACPVDVFCPGDGTYCCPWGANCSLAGWRCDAGSGTSVCAPYARDFLRCTLADTNSSWGSEVLGSALGVSSEPTSTPTPIPTLRPTRTPTPFGWPTNTPRPTRTPTPSGWPTIIPPWLITPSPIPTLYGVRNPDVDVYTVTVMESPPADVLSIFQTYSTHHFNLSEADDLSEILAQILDEIIKSMISYQIRRVVPTPIR